MSFKYLNQVNITITAPNGCIGKLELESLIGLELAYQLDRIATVLEAATNAQETKPIWVNILPTPPEKLT